MRAFWDSILRLGPFCWKSLIVLFLFFPRSYRYPQIFVDQQNVCNMQDDVEAIIGDTVSSSSFGGSSISLPSRRRRSKARFGDKNLIKWMNYHKFWGYIFDYFILVPGRIICKCVCMYVYINFFGFAMAFAKSWFHHHHRSLRQRDGLGTLGHHVVRPTPPVAWRRHGYNAALPSRLASLAFDSPSPRRLWSPSRPSLASIFWSGLTFLVYTTQKPKRSLFQSKQRKK